MIGDLTQREDELTGKTVLIIGLGRIGGRLAQLAKAFEMRVIGFRRDPAAGRRAADSVHTLAELPAFLPRGGFRRARPARWCRRRAGLIDAKALGLMRRSAFLVNVARGPCVVESPPDRGVAVPDASPAPRSTCTDPEPPEETSPLWAMPNVFITPHTGGETRKYEANVIEILVENLERMWRGETVLRNQVV